MMKRLGGRSVTVCSSNLWVRHKSLHERFQMRVLERRDEVSEGLPKVVDILCSLGKIVGEFDLRLAELTYLVDGELKAVLIFVDQTLDFEEIVLLEGIEHFFDVVPHLGFELSAAV